MRQEDQLMCRCSIFFPVIQEGMHLVSFKKSQEDPRPFAYVYGPYLPELQHLDGQWRSAIFLPIFTLAWVILQGCPFDCVAHSEYLMIAKDAH